jgi:cytochrome c oxidase assembly factor 3, fungi type
LNSSLKGASAAARAASLGGERKGIMPMLGRTEPGWLYDPTKSLVWGAPPVDNMGRIGDRTTKD